MTRVFEFSKYRDFLDKRFKEMPQKGYGKMSEVSRFIGVHTTLVSQVLKGHKNLTTDQAIKVAEFFNLSSLETDYFLNLVNLDRAGTPSAKQFYKNKINIIREQAKNIAKRVSADMKLTEEQRAVFYSDWAYSAVRQSVALPKVKNIEDIAGYLDLPPIRVKECVDFLIRTGLCKLSNDKLLMGPSSTHVEASSPWVRVHHTNWRNKAIQALDSKKSTNIHYTLPLTVSRDDSELIREKLLQLIENVRSIVDPSPSEEFLCLNIDWFQVTK